MEHRFHAAIPERRARKARSAPIAQKLCIRPGNTLRVAIHVNTKEPGARLEVEKLKANETASGSQFHNAGIFTGVGDQCAFTRQHAEESVLWRKEAGEPKRWLESLETAGFLGE